MVGISFIVIKLLLCLALTGILCYGQKHPSIHFLLPLQFSFMGGTEDYPSCHGERGGVHPG